MREPRIYVDLPLYCGLRLKLPLPAAHHVKRVLRRKAGQHIRLFNGTGGSYLAEIDTLGRREVQVVLLEFHELQQEPGLHITLAQGISRSQQMDYTLQKAVELGASTIVPVFSTHTNAQPGDVTQTRMEHWHRRIISACEQCGRERLPDLLAPVSFEQWLETDNTVLRLVLHPGTDRGLSSIDFDGKAISILAGAEGGFSSGETEKALSHGCTLIGMGPRVLRTETAAVAAIAICQSLWGDMG